MARNAKSISSCRIFWDFNIKNHMIFIALGTQGRDFSRCLRAFEELIVRYNLTEDVIVQAGNTKYESQRMKIVKFLKEDDFQEYVRNARIVVSHAGSGALFSSIKKGKKTIAVARLSKYGEMIDDHQTELCKKLSEEGYLIDGTFDMFKAWEQIQNFIPRKNDFECELPKKLKQVIDAYLSE